MGKSGYFFVFQALNNSYESVQFTSHYENSGQARAVTYPPPGHPIGSGGIHRKGWIEHKS
jgi:hypothetical protein